MTTNYPTTYKHRSHRAFINEDVTNAAVIVFISADDFKHPQYATEFNDLMATAYKASDTLVIYADDLPYGLEHIVSNDVLDYDVLTETHFLKIDRFLQRHADKPIIATCSAGVSRSGFVTWYLDVINDNLNGVTKSDRRSGGVVYANNLPNFEPDGYAANSQLTYYAIKNMTPELKARVEQIPNRQ